MHGRSSWITISCIESLRNIKVLWNNPLGKGKVGMKVYISFDIEGVSGIADAKDIEFDSPYFPEARRLAICRRKPKPSSVVGGATYHDRDLPGLENRMTVAFQAAVIGGSTIITRGACRGKSWNNCAILAILGESRSLAVFSVTELELDRLPLVVCFPARARGIRFHPGVLDSVGLNGVVDNSD